MCQEQFMNEESRETRMQSIQIGNHSGIYNQEQEAKETPPPLNEDIDKAATCSC